MTSQTHSVPAASLSERLRAGLGQRATGLVVALLLEAMCRQLLANQVIENFRIEKLETA